MQATDDLALLQEVLGREDRYGWQPAHVLRLAHHIHYMHPMHHKELERVLKGDDDGETTGTPNAGA